MDTQPMAERNVGCLFVFLSLPSAFVSAVRQELWHRSFPRPHKLHTAKEAMDVVAELTSEHGGIGAAFPYAQRAWELEPQNIQAAKFIAYRYTESRKFAEALPYLRVAVQGAHPDSVYVLMLKETLTALGRQSETPDNNAPGERR
jgi:hypothetical protein